jgi:hypothetical protein
LTFAILFTAINEYKVFGFAANDEAQAAASEINEHGVTGGRKGVGRPRAHPIEALPAKSLHPGQQWSMSRREFEERWHNPRGWSESDTVKQIHLGIFVRGGLPATPRLFRHVD